MPTTKKRINLTVPDQVYEKLQAYKEQNGIVNDASACLQLIVQQLKAQETTQQFMKLIHENSLEQIMQLSDEGLTYLKNESGKTLPSAE